MATLTLLTTLACVLCVTFGSSSPSQAQEDIARRLMRNYDLNRSPETANSGPVNVKLGLSMIDVVKADQDTNQVDLVMWTYLSWKDERLVFHRGPDANVSSISFQTRHLWMPDIVCYSQTGATEDIFPDIRVRVLSTGDIIYVPSGKYRIPCDLSGLKTSGGSAECTLKFGSWTAASNEIDLNFNGDAKIDLGDYFAGSKYEIVSNTATRNEEIFPCCPDKYVNLEYKISIKAK